MERILVDVYADRGVGGAPPGAGARPCPADAEAVTDYLAGPRGRARWPCRVPVRGPKRALLETVERRTPRSRSSATGCTGPPTTTAGPGPSSPLQRELGLPEAPLRIECYDMSHLQGTDYVGSMVVFEDGLPKKSDYRHFRVATVAGNDDYAAMEEVLTRRLTALLVEGPTATRPGPGGRPRARPGAGSPTRPSCCCSTAGWASSTWASQVLRAGADRADPVASLAKSFEEVYRPGSSDPIRLSRQSEGLYLLQRLRDEAHRFAISYPPRPCGASG